MSTVTTYIPPMWVHNRAIIRQKGTDGPDFVIRRIRLGGTSVGSKAELVPYDLCCGECHPDSVLDAATREVSLAEIVDRYQMTGRQMSAMRAPL